MKKLLLIPLVIAASLTLSGCATFLGSKVAQDLDNINNVLSGAALSPRAVVIAGNSVNAIQDTATAYLALPLCRSGSTPVCRIKAATQPIKRAVLAMRAARNGLEDWIDAHPGSAPPASLYEKVTAAISVLFAVITKYRVETVIAR